MFLPIPRVSVLLGGCGLCAVLGLLGCGPNIPTPPAISPEEVAARAIKQYDTNGDGVLDASELERCPALKTRIKSPNGKITAQQIADRLTKMVESNLARMSLTCKVLLNDQPLEGATVRLVPEQFMGEQFQPAVGTTNPDGIAMMKAADGSKDGVQWGYYRIEVSKKNSAGKETLPARYNTATTLGWEIAQDMRGGVVLKLQGS